MTGQSEVTLQIVRNHKFGKTLEEFCGARKKKNALFEKEKNQHGIKGDALGPE